MKKSYCLLLFLIAMAMLNSGCRKYLYQGPIGSTYDIIFWSTPAGPEQAVLVMYGQLRANLRNNFSWDGCAAHFVNGDLTAGTFVPSSESFLSYAIKPPTAEYRGYKGIPYYFNYVPYWQPILMNCSRYYKLIAQANLILKKAPQMPSYFFVNEETRKKFIAEALFMRSYAYFYMIRIWGDPVFADKFYEDIDYGNIPPKPRTAESVVLDSCLKDLKQAAIYFPQQDTAITSIRANGATNAALIAHIYAWKHQYDSAHVYCQKVINLNRYSLESMSNYSNLWTGSGSKENIFEIAMLNNLNDPNFKPGNESEWGEAKFACFATFLKGSAVADEKTSCWMVPLRGVVTNYLFVDTINDARYKKLFVYTPAGDKDSAGYMLLKYTNFHYQDSTKSILPYFDNNLVLLRLSDIYLLDAEALTMMGDYVNANLALSKTEIRAGINSYKKATTKLDLLNEIVAERGREFIGEGSWYYDLIRTESLIQGISGVGSGWLEKVGYGVDRTNPLTKGYYWPLDMTTLFPQDNLLTQNPYFIDN